jgi:type IV pilus assembly protein PilP
MRVLASISICALALAGCGNGEQKALQQELAALTKGAKGRVEPLPKLVAYTPVNYTAADLPDPFSAGKIAEGPKAATSVQSEGDRLYEAQKARPKEPLEAYPLESLAMVGTLQQKGQVYGLVKADTALYRVRPGNYMGQNFGVVTKIEDGEIVLKELIQDGSGDWSERITAVSLQESAGARK